MNKSILIVGKGYIGEKLAKELNCPLSDKRINNFEDVHALIKTYQPKIIINCIGHTGQRNVDDCELALDKTLHANSYVPMLLAEGCLRNNIRLVHISSGCIYDFNYSKSAPLTEDQIPDFYKLYYSRTKIYAENFLLELSKRYDILIIRIRVPLDNRTHPRNVLTKIINYKTIIDVPNSVTYIPDFVKAMKHLIKVKATGIYNVACEGGLLYQNILDVYKKYHPEFEYKIISLKKLNLIRTNLILSTKKLAKTGFKVRKIKDILQECVKEYVKTK